MSHVNNIRGGRVPEGGSEGFFLADPDPLAERLRAGDEAAFRSLVRQLQRSLTAVALGFVRNPATADEVVQDTWLAVIDGLDGFEGRSSVKNWVFAILANKARTRAVRDGRMVSVADFDETGSDDAPVVDPARFAASGAWAAAPSFWEEVTPERIVGGRQMLAHVSDAIEELPPAQRSVLLLREVEHLEPGEVGALLGLSAVNQRVLLHRARARVRDHLERVLGQ